MTPPNPFVSRRRLLASAAGAVGVGALLAACGGSEGGGTGGGATASGSLLEFRRSETVKTQYAPPPWPNRSYSHHFTARAVNTVGALPDFSLSLFCDVVFSRN